jgi:hypothetical protein
MMLDERVLFVLKKVSRRKKTGDVQSFQFKC